MALPHLRPAWPFLLLALAALSGCCCETVLGDCCCLRAPDGTCVNPPDLKNRGDRR